MDVVAFVNDNDFQICSGCSLQIYKSQKRAHREDICRNFMKPIEEKRAVFKIDQVELYRMYKHRGTNENNFNDGYKYGTKGSRFSKFDCFGNKWSMELYLEDIHDDNDKLAATGVFVNLKLGGVTDCTVDIPLKDVTVNIQLLAKEDKQKSFVTRHLNQTYNTLRFSNLMVSSCLACRRFS